MAHVVLLLMMLSMAMLSYWLMKEMWDWFKNGR
jgi:hypothetical protein